jgi:hypothetical protein
MVQIEGRAMPTKRRKIGATRIAGALTDRMHAELMTGGNILGFEDAGIEDDEHGRKLWARHRDELLRDESYNATYPGRRPWAFWRYEHGLKPNPGGYPGHFRWPRGIRSEQHLVHKLLSAGLIDPLPLVPDELDQIERTHPGLCRTTTRTKVPRRPTGARQKRTQRRGAAGLEDGRTGETVSPASCGPGKLFLVLTAPAGRGHGGDST